jgi:hypothetical protein
MERPVVAGVTPRIPGVTPIRSHLQRDRRRQRQANPGDASRPSATEDQARLLEIAAMTEFFRRRSLMTASSGCAGAPDSADGHCRGDGDGPDALHGERRAELKSRSGEAATDLSSRVLSRFEFEFTTLFSMTDSAPGFAQSPKASAERQGSARSVIGGVGGIRQTAARHD